MSAALAYALPERNETPAPAAPPRSEPICDLKEKQGRREARSASGTAAGFVYDGVRAGRAVRAGLSRRSACGRPLPMEEIAFFVKEVDNSGLRRAADPSDRGAWARMVAMGCLVLLAAVLILGPRAWLRHSGYRLNELAEQREDLLRVQQQLLVRQAQLTEYGHVTGLAAAQGFSNPELENYAWQSGVPADDSALAQTFLEEAR